MTPEFHNDDTLLRQGVAKVLDERKRHGLSGLVGGLAAVVVRVQPDRLSPAVGELLDRTGYRFASAHAENACTSCVLTCPGSADILVCTSTGPDNPFRAANLAPKSAHLPDTRLETFVFETPDLARYVAIQKARGVRFLTEEPLAAQSFRFIQTRPSAYTGNSLGFIQRLGRQGDYRTASARDLDWSFPKPDKPHLRKIFELDHTAARVRAEHRDPAILEFMDLTNYDFDFAVYVESLNSITNVARLPGAAYAQVFTSGITPFADLSNSGPTEKYIRNYGARVHHWAFRAEDIDATFAALKADGMEFLVELVGSRAEGLQQTFGRASEHTLLVSEYIHRYDGFDGFFTKGNVTQLTRATEAQ